VTVCWPDVPGPSFCVDGWLWPWLQSWLQSRGCPQPERANPNRISSLGRGCPDRFKLDHRRRSVLPERCRAVLNCNPNCNPAVSSSPRISENEHVTDFGGPREFTTWDGEPVSRDRPHGATVVVASRAPDGWQYLLLHRVHHGGPAREGNWAWTPPTGSRKPGEDVTACAVRELHEEVGLQASPQPVLVDDADWAVYALEVPWGVRVAIDGQEHDRFEWVGFAEARRRCRPVELAESFTTACQASGFGWPAA
jgi:8-oxo-dGTP pyrophosphatase MutT (NUDIX family)